MAKLAPFHRLKHKRIAGSVLRTIRSVPECEGVAGQAGAAVARNYDWITVTAAQTGNTDITPPGPLAADFLLHQSYD